MPDIENAPCAPIQPRNWEGPPVQVRFLYSDGSPPRVTTQRNRRVAEMLVEAMNAEPERRDWYETPVTAAIVGGMEIDHYSGL